MEEERIKAKERRGKKMKVSEAKLLTLEEFSKLDDEFGGFDSESSKNHPIRKEGEGFMDFMKKGSKKIKNDPVVKKILE